MISKNKFFLLLILLYLPNKGFASNLKVGLHSAIGFSTISATNAPREFNIGKGFLPGFHFGLSSEFILYNNYNIVTEINFSSKGYSNIFSGIRVRSHYNYITIPIKLKTRISEQIYFQFGPYIGIAIKEYIKNNVSDQKVYGSIGNSINSEPPNTLKPFDFGLETGIAYEFENFSIGCFLSYGILNTRPGGGIGSSIRNLSTQIRFHYNILNKE